MERSTCSLTNLEGEITAIITIEIDLAKNVFAVHGVDAKGKLVWNDQPAECFGG
jgi:hypothetical protein